MIIITGILAGLAILSLALTVWQWIVAKRFPLHHRLANPGPSPDVTLFKPLKGCDEHTRDCLRSWLRQKYRGHFQVLFGVADADDPACALVRELILEHPEVDAELIICGPPSGSNAKVCSLAKLEAQARHDVVIISDADVYVEEDFLENVAMPLKARHVGLVNCFYRLANPATAAMHWEAVAINADFWSQVLQSWSLKPLDFALGAVMATRRSLLREIGGFEALKDCLADDYQLGNRIFHRGYRIELCPVVVECWSGTMDWGEVWSHQLRWARTIRVCQPVPYFFSILSNGTLWPLLWLLVVPSPFTLAVASFCLAARVLMAADLQARFEQTPLSLRRGLMALLKDLLQAALWLLAFLGNHVEWRGQKLYLNADGTIRRSVSPNPD